MAEVQQNNSGSGKKSAQKKMTIRVDFTPMVDMNMLLITFFMLCTTMIKSQTLNIALPSNEKVQNEENMSQASADDAVTIIIDAKRKPGSYTPDTVNGQVVNELYYYDGKPCGGEAVPTAENNNLKKADAVGSKDEAKDIRKIIQNRNKDVWKKIEVLKKDFREGKITQEQFDVKAKEVRKDESLKKPVIIIKSTPEASYGALVEMLDEMQINSVSKYQIDNMTRMDSTMLIEYQNRNR